MTTPVYQRIYAVVRRIPQGKVASYGLVATIAGLPGRARQVGYAMHALPGGTTVPWHRVVNAMGRVSRRRVPGGELTQRMLLEREGVRFSGSGRIDLKHFGWTPRSGRKMRTRRLSICLVLLLGLACHHGPPPDFTPDPGLIAQIREIRMAPQVDAACPGQSFRVSYTAVLEDGTTVPFATRFDRDNPPRLHVQFLDLNSPQADPERDGGWDADADPWRSVLTGFELEAVLRAKPSVRAATRVPPMYDCMDRTLSFHGANGRDASGKNSAGKSGDPGRDGPDITVRLGIVRSPFVERLLIASIEVGRDAPRYRFADADRVAPRAWLRIESRGGSGGDGGDGAPGKTGVTGKSGCPGGAGGQGGDGQYGGPGAVGGDGGSITIVVSESDRFLSGVVDPVSSGGDGGRGGKGGTGGDGGAGGAADGPTCSAGPAGASGRDGSSGSNGRRGRGDREVVVITSPLNQVFGSRIPPELNELLRPR